MPQIRFKTCIVYAIILMLCIAPAFAQQKKWSSNMLLEARFNYGFLINHHLEMRIFNSHFPAFEINLGKETDGREKWQSKYNYPVIGMSYWYSHLGNSPLLGNANAVFPYINYPLLKSRKSLVNFRLGVGLAYISKPFDRLTNYKYIAIGSHINAAINLLAEYRLQLGPRSNIAIGMSMMHFSNGSTKTPNYGINAVLGNIAFAYRLNKSVVQNNKKLLPSLYMFEFPEKKYLNFSVGNIIAFKDMGSEYGKNFMIYNFYGNIMKEFSFKSSAGLELNVTHNRSDIYIDNRDSLNLKNPILRFAIAPMYELRTGKLSYDFGVGFYVNKIALQAFAYFKIGFKYQITPHLFTSLALHTHLGQADFVGIGLGYKFSRSYTTKL